MPNMLLAALAFALVAAVIALAREVRLRRALAKLLQRILAHWRADATSQDDRRLDP
jgi:hypothetical protein